MIALVLHSDCIAGYWFYNSNGIFAYQLLLFWNKYSPTSISFDQTCEEGQNLFYTNEANLYRP